jgi:coenzyme Q-binding protein COQ10
MTVYAVSHVIMAPRSKVFDLVADVESYPDFLPLWRDANVYRRDGDRYYTEREVGLGRIKERFHTRTHLVRPMHIEVTSDDERFKEFFIRWDFDTIGTGCRISVALTWEMKVPSLQSAIDHLLPRAARSMVAAFEKRALTTLGAPRAPN